MQYAVRALSADHLVMPLMIEAADEVGARRQVEARGLFVASIEPASTSLFAAEKPRNGAKQLSLVLFSQELLALLNAGLSIVECLEALLEKEANVSTSAVLTRLLSGLREGKRFSGVLGDQPNVFPPLYIGIIKAAEGTSDLPRALTRYIDYQQRIDVIRSKIISAAIYPVILMIAGGAVSFFLIGYVVPRFAQVYEGAGRDLPWMSQLLLKWGQFAASHTEPILWAVLAAIVMLGFGMHHFLAKGGLAKLISKLPGVGERAHIYELARLYLTLGMLLEGGIPIVAAMDTVAGVVSPGLKPKLNSAKETIESGTALSMAFAANGLTTPISLRMLRVGERSGELGQMLTQSAAFYDGEISRWIDRFTRTFEPLLMAAIGIVVGVIVVLLYMPIFDLAGSLS
jgi:general secretion pathway protein F